MLGAVNGFNEMMEYVENLIRKAVGYKLYITKKTLSQIRYVPILTVISGKRYTEMNWQS